MKISDKRISW